MSSRAPRSCVTSTHAWERAALANVDGRSSAVGDADGDVRGDHTILDGDGAHTGVLEDLGEGVLEDADDVPHVLRFERFQLRHIAHLPVQSDASRVSRRADNARSSARRGDGFQSAPANGW